MSAIYLEWNAKQFKSKTFIWKILYWTYVFYLMNLYVFLSYKKDSWFCIVWNREVHFENLSAMCSTKEQTLKFQALFIGSNSWVGR